MKVSEVLNNTKAFILAEKKDIFTLTYAINSYAKLSGFDAFESGLISTAVSEIATNVIRYAHNGEALIRPCSNGKGIEVEIQDNGRGIKNIELAMKDGYSTMDNSFGLGLGAAKRAMDEMHITTSSSGTQIILRKYLSMLDMDIGKVSYSKVNEPCNGDAYFIKKYEGDKVFIAVLDGAGHGEKAKYSSQAVLKLLEECYRLPLDEIVKKGNNLLQDEKYSRGVEIALLRITPEYIEALVLGNVSIHSYSSSKCSVAVQNGQMGISLPDELFSQSFKRPDTFSFILHSDGIENFYSSKALESEFSSQKLAESIFDTYSIAHDDATIVVVRG